MATHGIAQHYHTKLCIHANTVICAAIERVSYAVGLAWNIAAPSIRKQEQHRIGARTHAPGLRHHFRHGLHLHAQLGEGSEKVVHVCLGPPRVHGQLPLELCALHKRVWILLHLIGHALHACTIIWYRIFGWGTRADGLQAASLCTAMLHWLETGHAMACLTGQICRTAKCA